MIYLIIIKFSGSVKAISLIYRSKKKLKPNIFFFLYKLIWYN